MGMLRTPHRTWRMGGGGSVPRQLLPHRCSSTSAHSQDVDPSVHHATSGGACGGAVLLVVLSRSERVWFHALAGGKGSCLMVGHRDWRRMLNRLGSTSRCSGGGSRHADAVGGCLRGQSAGGRPQGRQ